MAAKQEGVRATKSVVVATTYLAEGEHGRWRMWRVELLDDGTLRKTLEVEHPERLVIRERLVTRLMSRGVLP